MVLKLHIFMHMFFFNKSYFQLTLLSPSLWFVEFSSEILLHPNTVMIMFLNRHTKKGVEDFWSPPNDILE